MINPAYALLRHAMDDDIYLQYIDDPREYHTNRKASAAALEHLRTQLDEPTKKLLDIFLDEASIANVMEEEAAFTTGLAFGLQLMALLSPPTAPLGAASR